MLSVVFIRMRVPNGDKILVVNIKLCLYSFVLTVRKLAQLSTVGEIFLSY